MEYVSKLQDAFDIQEEYCSAIDERTKTQRLVDGMHNDPNTVITMAKEKVKEDMLDNFMTAVTHLQTKISTEYPPRKQQSWRNHQRGHNPRQISQVNGQQGRGGKGRGGGGRGRGNY